MVKVLGRWAAVMALLAGVSSVASATPVVVDFHGVCVEKDAGGFPPAPDRYELGDTVTGRIVYDTDQLSLTYSSTTSQNWLRVMESYNAISRFDLVFRREGEVFSSINMAAYPERMLCLRRDGVSSGARSGLFNAIMTDWPATYPGWQESAQLSLFTNRAPYVSGPQSPSVVLDPAFFASGFHEVWMRTIYLSDPVMEHGRMMCLFDVDSLTVTVPEPGTLVLLLVGSLTLRRRRQ